MKATKFLIWVCLMLSVAWWLLLFAGESKYEANLDFVFSCADENAQIENERMKRQIETSRKRFLSKTSLQRTVMQFCENNMEYSSRKEVVSNVVFECEMNSVEKNRHIYRIKLVAPSKILAEKILKFVFATYQKALEERREIVFQKNAARIEDLQKREELRKLINADCLKIEMYGDVRIRKMRWLDVFIDGLKEME